MPNIGSMQENKNLMELFQKLDRSRMPVFKH